MKYYTCGMCGDVWYELNNKQPDDCEYKCSKENFCHCVEAITKTQFEMLNAERRKRWGYVEDSKRRTV